MKSSYYYPLHLIIDSKLIDLIEEIIINNMEQMVDVCFSTPRSI